MCSEKGGGFARYTTLILQPASHGGRRELDNRGALPLVPRYGWPTQPVPFAVLHGFG